MFLAHKTKKRIFLNGKANLCKKMFRINLHCNTQLPKTFGRHTNLLFQIVAKTVSRPWNTQRCTDAQEDAHQE